MFFVVNLSINYVTLEYNIFVRTLDSLIVFSNTACTVCGRVYVTVQCLSVCQKPCLTQEQAIGCSTKAEPCRQAVSYLKRTLWPGTHPSRISRSCEEHEVHRGG